MKRISVLTTLFVSLLISFSLGCDSGGAKPGPSTSSSTATAVASTSEPAPAPLPKLDRPPDLPMNEVVKTSAGGLTTKVRAILRTLTPTDDLPVALVWQRVKPDRKDPLGKQGFDFYKTSESFRIKVRPPKGKWQSFTVKPQTASRHKITYPVAVGMVFRIDGHGVGLARGRIKLAWNKPDPKLFSQPGKYSIVVAGSIALAKKAISFESGEFTIEVVAASDEFKSIEALEALAAKDLAARRRLKKNPEPRKETIGDSQGIRLVRFSLDPKKAKAPSYNVDFVEVVIVDRTICGEVAVNAENIYIISTGHAPVGKNSRSISSADFPVSVDITRGQCEHAADHVSHAGSKVLVHLGRSQCPVVHQELVELVAIPPESTNLVR